jgi:hypothetical protein
MKKKLAVLGASVATFAPLLAFAQVSTAGTCTFAEAGLQTVICQIYKLIKIAIPVMILGAVAFFINGVIKFVIAGDAEEKTEGRSIMIWGIIGFAVIMSIWGLVYLLQSTFGLNSATSAPLIPVFQ